MLRLLPFHPYLAPISSLSIFAIPGDRTPNLTMILITTDHYTPYPKYRPWSRPMHSLMAIHHLDSCTALWLFTSWIPHVYLMVTSCSLLHLLYLAPILFAIPGDRTPNLTMILITTLLNLSTVPGLDSCTASWLNPSARPRHLRNLWTGHTSAATY